MQSKNPPQGSLGRKLNGFDENDLFWLILELKPEDGLTTDFSFSFFHSLILLLSGRASLGQSSHGSLDGVSDRRRHSMLIMLVMLTYE